MKVIEGASRVAFLAFFLSHIPITLFVDAQGLFGPHYPKLLTDLIAWYCGLFGDVLMKNAPSGEYAWFSSLIGCEILFQLPFFIVAARTIMTAGKCNGSSTTNPSDGGSTPQESYPEWFRIACIVYGSHVSTTLVPILSCFVWSEEMTTGQKCATTASKYRIESTRGRRCNSTLCGVCWLHRNKWLCSLTIGLPFLSLSSQYTPRI